MQNLQAFEGMVDVTKEINQLFAYMGNSDYRKAGAEIKTLISKCYSALRCDGTPDSKTCIMVQALMDAFGFIKADFVTCERQMKAFSITLNQALTALEKEDMEEVMFSKNFRY